MHAARWTRRSALAAGAMLCLAGPAEGDKPKGLARQPGYAAWRAPHADPLPLEAMIDTGVEQMTLRAWLGGRPAVLSLWATWCPPCLAEKASQAAMSRRLTSANAAARILVLQSYDDVSLEQGRAVLTKLRAADLINARAGADAERAFISVFGASPVDPGRTSMPSLLLIGADGAELGRALGMMTAPDQRTDYWAAQSTFDFLSSLR